jgi:tetratricopeptide (TPR) repeat protein/S1-C subfamily serine protease
MKLPKNLYKLSHLLLFLLLLFPASPIIITGCSSSLFARKPGTLSESELKNILKEITVKILVDDRETASGTIIKKQNGFYTVLTNAHVIENAKSVKVVTPDNKTHDVEFSKLDRQDNKKDDLYDLARLTFSSETTYLVAGLGEEDIKPGEKVFAGGYVKGNLQTTKGTAKLFLNQPLIKGQQIAYDNDIQQGMSGGAIINEKGYLVGINSKLAHPVLQTDFRYLKGEQPDDKTLKEWGNYSWGIAINLVDEAAPDLALFPERVIRKVGGIPAKVLDIAKQSSVKIEGKSGIGSGVIIAKDKDVYYVLTAAHVVENKQEYQVVAPDKQVYKVDNETIRTRKGLDMAVLQFRSSQVYQVATLGDYKLKNQYVFLYGWKGEELNHPSLFSVGVVGNPEINDFWAKSRGYELAYTNEGYPGMSGGGIWDAEGKLVGIHNYADTEILGYSLGLSIQSLLFYEKDGLWKLPKHGINIITKEPIIEQDIWNNFLNFSLSNNASKPDTVHASGNDWLRYGIQRWRIEQISGLLTNGSVESFKKDTITAMNNAITKKPDLWQAYYNMAIILASHNKYESAHNKYESALKYIDIAISYKPSFYLSYLVKADIYRSMKNYKAALISLNTAISQAKEDNKKYDLDDFIYTMRGEMLGELKRYEEAINDFTKVIEINPQSVYAYYNRGLLYGKQEKSELAIANFTKAIEINPQFAQAYYTRGAGYILQRKIELGIADFTKAIEINPQFRDAYYIRGINYKDQGKIELAIADFTQAIKYNPKIADAYYYRGISYYVKKEIDYAIDDFTQAIKYNPKYLEAYYSRGVIYSEKGKIDLAIADYTQAIKYNPKYLEAYNNRGFSYRQQGKIDLAIADYTQAIAIKPQEAPVYKNRGIAYLEQKKLDQAIQDFNKAIEINHKDVESYNFRGLTYLLKLKKQQGIKDLETAKQLYQQQGNIQKYQEIQDLLNKL